MKLRNSKLMLLSTVTILLLACKKEKEGQENLNNNVHPYDVSTLAPTGNSLNTSNKTNNARDIQLIGDSLLFIHSRGTNTVESYKLHSIGAINSASHFNTFFTADYIGTTSQGNNGHGIYIKPNDLSKMWLFNRTEIWEFHFESPGDLSSVNFSDYLDLSDYIERGHGIFFNPTGGLLYVDDRNKEMIHQFTLNENWSISGFNNYKNINISSFQEAVRSVKFNPEGDQMYLLDTSLKEIIKFNLTTPWQVESATFSKKKSVNISNPRGFTWNSDGTKAYIMNTDDGVIYEYQN
jgi:hypothetical protein